MRDSDVNNRRVMEQAMAIRGMTRPEELAFLFGLARQTGIGGTFVELGTYLGRTLTVLVYAAQMRKCRVYSLDNYTYDGRCSLDQVRTNLISAGAKKQLEEGSIVLLDGDSRQRPDFITSVDLLFVDSIHTRQHFDAEMKAWLNQVSVGGIIVCHDYGSPTYLEMTEAIEHWFFNADYQGLGLVRRLIAFKKLKGG